MWLKRVGHALEHHPKRVTALIAALMLGGGGGAFAVASLGPDPSAMPVREVLEAVEPLPLEAQSEALDIHRFQLYSSETLRSSDTVDSLLGRMGIHDPAAAAFLRADPAFRTNVLGRAGRQVRVEANDTHQLLRLSARWMAPEPGQFRRLVVERQGERFTARLETDTLQPSTRLGSGTLRSSLFAAVDEAGIPDEVAMQLVDMFSGDIDFHRSLRRGDRFSVVYETLEADGEPLRTGRVLSAEFLNAGRTLQAMWFQEPGRPGAYYGLDGRSLQKAFLASPMEVSRVTSGFKMRFHPILRTWRAHLGVDYGAPTGTAVRSIGDGRVAFAGRMGGYGNVVQLDHGKGAETLYAHLSRMDVRTGQTVTRGQRIGAVGATGWATGPHLHFEFRENGVQRDPLEVARRSQGVELSAQSRPAFERAAQSMRVHLAAAATVSRVASAE